MATGVAFFEITCGLLVIAGLITRLASVPLLTIISVAIATTKLPMLSQQGFWAMAHEARTDWCMFLGSLFLIIAGAGRWSLDALITSTE
jgi:putative oxidoreductase